jgi:hypothetical protein
MRLDAEDLVIASSAGETRHRKPSAYQEIGGRRIVVEARFVLNQHTRILSFKVGHFDRSQDLVIDPVVVYSTFLGGSGNEQVYGVATDPNGNTYVTGVTNSPNFPGAVVARSNDVFVSKLSPDGQTRLFTTLLGGSANDGGTAIAVDATGHAYITGGTASADFPASPPQNGFFNCFVMKLDVDGASVLYSKRIGGTQSDGGSAIAIDTDGNAYIAGTTQSNDLPTTNAVQPAFGGGGYDGFAAKLSPAGSIQYLTYLGGNGIDFANGIAVHDGNAYIAGHTSSPDFPVANAYQSIPGGPAGTSNAFVIKLSASGTRIFATFLGGSMGSLGRAIAVDAGGNAYVTGSTQSTDFPTVDAFQPQRGGVVDIFVSKLSPNGLSLLYSSYLGGSDGSSLSEALAIAVDSLGAAYLGGFTTSDRFPTPNGFQRASCSLECGVTAKVAADGRSLAFASFVGGNNGTNKVYGIAVSGTSVVVGGTTTSVGFPTVRALQSSYGGNNPGQTFGLGDGFVTRVQDGPPGCEIALSPSAAIISNLGGLLSVGITSPPGCPWATDSIPSWIHATSPTSGSGLGAIHFVIDPWGGELNREAALMIAGHLVMVRQIISFGCFSSVTPSTVFVPASGSTGTVTVDYGACAWFWQFNAPWLDIGPIGPGTGRGAFSYAVAPNAGAARTGTIDIVGRTLTVNQASGIVLPPMPAAVTPASGSGASQAFTFTFSDPRGSQDLGVLNILINNFLDGRRACYLAYSQPQNLLYLVNDLGDGLLPGAFLTGAGSLSNSQCSVSWLNSPVAISGNTLGLTLTIAFQPAFAGNKVMYMAARDIAENNSGWQALGTWQVAGGSSGVITVANMAPGRGSGPSQTFTFNFTDTNGFANLGVMNILLNNFLDGRQACYLAYSRRFNLLYLVSDDGGGLLPGASLNAPGSLSNSQCTVSWGASPVAGSGNALALALNFGFSPGFAGNRVFYLAARDVNEGNNTDWQVKGSWTVQ